MNRMGSRKTQANLRAVRGGEFFGWGPMRFIAAGEPNVPAPADPQCCPDLNHAEIRDYFSSLLMGRDVTRP